MEYFLQILSGINTYEVINSLKCTLILRTPVISHTHTHTHTHKHKQTNKQTIGIMVRMFDNDPRNLGSMPKSQNMLLEASLVTTQHFKIGIKGK